MDASVFINAARQALIVTVLVSAPPILAALVVGLSVSVLQALTQVQEATLGTFGKMVAVFATLFFLGYWMMSHISRMAFVIFSEFPNWVR
jgi:flagellar biosynthesis protein FliQ